ncbi:hypothetical protein A7U60_g5036 [Sanghuangporus baumii]|uniref:Uncharacterized protein n=1 Tax=Sanghuangporus baumii TaxID=108892 RepID=A0A9Q5HXX8_SANBA|nr:hypothetical protein A7U60_g5036 [Sanghuangporus baumii]
MNPTRQLEAFHGHTDPPCHLGPKDTRQTHNQSEPAFMQPLLPPQHIQNAYAPGPSSSCSPVHTPPSDFFAQPPAFQGHIPAAQLQNFQGQDIAPYVPDVSDEEYPLQFPSFDAFQHWRSHLEEQETVEFVKTETYRSKTVPPNFREHTKLLCIFNQHSHPIGRENLPFTRRGRNIAEHERRAQQQNGFSRTNAIRDGTILPAASSPTASNNREVRNYDGVRIEPPPMASLKPPDPLTKDSPGASVECPQKQHHIGCIQVSPPQDRLPCLTLQDGALVSALSPQSPAIYGRNRGDAVLHPSEAAFVVPPIARSNGRNQVYRVPPPPSYDPNAPVRQPQPTEALGHQAQYLPTPTTPSTQIQNLHSSRYPYPYSEALCCREPGTQNQAAPLSNGAHVSPISPVTPHTQNLPGPPAAVDVRSTVPQYAPREVYSFDENRWNRLDAFFQAVRLRARSYPFPEPAVATLESLLSGLYMEGHEMYSRPESDQPPTYHQQQQQQEQQRLQ